MGGDRVQELREEMVSALLERGLDHSEATEEMASVNFSLAQDGELMRITGTAGSVGKNIWGGRRGAGRGVPGESVDLIGDMAMLIMKRRNRPVNDSTRKGRA